MPGIIQTVRSGATEHPEELFNFLDARLVSAGGVFDISNDSLLVEELSSPVMKIQVNEGYAILRSPDGSMVFPVWLHDGTIEADVTANGSGNSRIDSVVVYIDLGQAPNDVASNVAKIAVVAGTPSGSPTAPDDSAIQSAIGANNPYAVIANLTVISGATEIENADISDQRTSPDLTIPQAIFTGKATFQGKRNGPIYNNGNSGTSKTINFANGETQKLTLTGNCTISFTNVEEGDYLTLYLIQDGTGGRTVTWPAGTKSFDDAFPDLESSASAINIVGIRAFSDTEFHIVASSANIGTP